VKPAKGPAYLLTRAKRGDTDLVMNPVPKGRKPASSMTINGQADSLSAFHFDDLRAAPATAPATVDRATFRTFDGQVFELTGHRDTEKAFISVVASRDPALAAQFPEPVPEKPAAPVTPAATPASPAAPAGAAQPATAAPATPRDESAEHLAARAKGLEFEIPLYKYESIFKPQDDLLEKPPAPAAAARPAKPSKAAK